MRTHIVYPIVAFTPRRKPVSYAADCGTVLDALTNNGQFPSVAAAVTTAKAALATYEGHIDDVNNDVVGAVQARDDAKTPLKVAMKAVVDQVQAQIDKTPDQATSLAASAKMKLRKVPVRNKEELAVADGPLSGEVALVAKAIPGARTYYWEYSSDGTNWLRAPDTTKANTIVVGLTVGQKYSFRVHALTTKGPTALSQVKSHVVR